MELKLKIGTARGYIEPRAFMLAKNEYANISVEGKNIDGCFVVINETAYRVFDGKVSIPSDAFSEHNTIWITKDEDGEIKTIYKIDNIVVSVPSGEMHEDELEFYKKNYVVLSERVKKLETFQANATKDILNLTNAINALNEEFKSVKEEMSL